MIGQKLYMAAWVDSGAEFGECEDHFDCECFSPIPEPAGWREYALERWPDGPREGEVWPNGYQPFFFPKTGVPYKSRSSAQRRVDMINRWGGKAVVMECTPVWETVEAAKARRAQERLDARIEKKQRELADLINRSHILRACRAVTA